MFTPNATRKAHFSLFTFNCQLSIINFSNP